MTSGASVEDLAALTKAAARDYVELLTTCPKDKAACEEARLRYKAAQAAEIRAVSQRNDNDVMK